MNVTEIIVVIGGLILGYWLVSLFSTKKVSPVNPPKPDSPKPEDAAPPQPPPKPPPSRQEWHHVLEVRPTASDTDIRNAYRNQMSKYHPDKVASLGAELKAVAERKSKEIGDAYREGMRSRDVEV